jgi:hypothetical protein
VGAKAAFMTTIGKKENADTDGRQAHGKARGENKNPPSPVNRMRGKFKDFLLTCLVCITTLERNGRMITRTFFKFFLKKLTFHSARKPLSALG